MMIIIRYALFAAISTLMNLGTQELVVRSSPIAPLTISIVAGTIVGFAVKYALDKRWIFFDGYDGHAREALKIALYGIFSVLTTLVFWGFEVAFWIFWRTDLAKYCGAVLGLALGYAAKYLIDRNLVFTQRSRPWSSAAGGDSRAARPTSSAPRRPQSFRAYRRSSEAS
jgi:putative flippase GtrA